MKEELKKLIVEFRERMYVQLQEDTRDEKDQKLKDHIEREYSTCDIDELTEQIMDSLLDSLGS